MLKKTILLGALSVASGLASAGGMGDTTYVSPFYVGTYGGYGVVDGGYSQDGNVAFGRLALGMHGKDFYRWQIGGEVGVQSGNYMRLAASQAVIGGGGGLVPQANLKPLLDLLVTVKGGVGFNTPYYYLLKGGIAYRQLSLTDRNSSQDTLNKVSGEFQGGLGVNLTEHVMLNAFYQGIYSSSNAGVALNSVFDTTIANIPTQQAGFLGIEYSFM